MSTFTHTWNDLRWLTCGDAEPFFLLAADAGLSQLQQADRLRRILSPERARLVLEQTALRRRANEKFAAAERMHFTPTSLEQATDEQIARHKARRFPAAELVLDLCCGIGGDLLALAERGPVLGVELDRRLALLAATNLRAWRTASCPQARSTLRDPCYESLVICGDASRLRIAPDVAWHIDPDRRAGGHRTVDPRHFSPGLDVLQAMLTAAPHAAVKLAPATTVPESWAGSGELEWISRDGECRQQVAWLGRLAATPGMRRATRVGMHGETSSIVGSRDVPLDVAPSLGCFLHEPDAAVLAARLTASLATELQFRAIEPKSAYLTSDSPARHNLVASFEIEAVMPLDLRRLRQYLRARGIGHVEIKKRGVEHDPALVRTQLALRGARRATVVLTRVAGRGVAIVAQRQITEPA